ncbi:MAG: iron-sulfur cluster assembly scaffold protein [Planctomycetota bacterium]
MSDFDDAIDEMQEMIVEQAREQYSETVVDHWLHPRNFGPMDHPDGHARVEGECGDSMDIFLRVRDGRIVLASFLTDGCITSIAAGSMAVKLAGGVDLAAARTVSDDAILDALGGLPEESEHCALLASNTLHAAVEDHGRSRQDSRGLSC